MLDDAADAALLALGHRHDARADRRHLGAKVERVDRAQQRAAEGRPCRRQRLVGVDGELGAVGGEPREKRRGDGACEIAAEVGRAEQQDLGLVDVDQLGQRPGVGFVAVFGEDRVLDQIGDVGAVGEALGGRLARPRVRRADDDGRRPRRRACRRACAPSPISSHDTGWTWPRSSSTMTHTCL